MTSSNGPASRTKYGKGVPDNVKAVFERLTSSGDQQCPNVAQWPEVLLQLYEGSRQFDQDILRNVSQSIESISPDVFLVVVQGQTNDPSRELAVENFWKAVRGLNRTNDIFEAPQARRGRPRTSERHGRRAQFPTEVDRDFAIYRLLARISDILGPSRPWLDFTPERYADWRKKALKCARALKKSIEGIDLDVHATWGSDGQASDVEFKLRKNPTGPTLIRDGDSVSLLRSALLAEHLVSEVTLPYEEIAQTRLSTRPSLIFVWFIRPNLQFINVASQVSAAIALIDLFGPSIYKPQDSASARGISDGVGALEEYRPDPRILRTLLERDWVGQAHAKNVASRTTAHVSKRRARA